MSADRSPKPANDEGPLRTMSFSLAQRQVDQLRAIAYARDVSLSQVAREAFDIAFAHWGASGAAPQGDRVRATERPGTLEIEEDRTRNGGEHTLAHWPLAFRRQAARHGESGMVHDRKACDEKHWPKKH